jgi:hypothetical protein
LQSIDSITMYIYDLGEKSWHESRHKIITGFAYWAHEFNGYDSFLFLCRKYVFVISGVNDSNNGNAYFGYEGVACLSSIRLCVFLYFVHQCI